MASSLEAVSPSSEMSPSTRSRSQVAFSLQKGDAIAIIYVEMQTALALNAYKAHFLETLAQHTPEADSWTTTSSAPGLALQFLRHLIDNDACIDTVTNFMQAFELRYTHTSEIHSVVASAATNVPAQKRLLEHYFSALAYTSTSFKTKSSALLNSASNGDSKLLAVFGGQGSANAYCVRELKTLHVTYGHLLNGLITKIQPLLVSLSQHMDTKHFFTGREINLHKWLSDDADELSDEFVASAAVSFPIIGLLDLAHYCITCQILGISPGELAKSLYGVSGHSQGIVVAAAVAMSSSWDTFYHNAAMAIESLFWIGFESHHSRLPSFVPDDTVHDCVANGEGRPTPMLSVRGVERDLLNEILRKCNSHLPTESQIHIALANSRTNFVVAAPTASLCGLCRYLKDVTAPEDADQTRIPFSQRKPTITRQFLPISAPFHTKYLKEAADSIKRRLRGKQFTSTESHLSLLHTTTREKIDCTDATGLVDTLVDAVTTGFVDFPHLLSDTTPSHIVVFGLGRLSELVRQNRRGHGQRIIYASEVGTPEDDLGYKAELFSTMLSSRGRPWSEEYAPQLIQTDEGSLIVDTKLSRLIQAPPVLTAGMTPTTVPWDFVAAVMNAGYYAELAGGGYFSEAALEKAIMDLVASIPPGRGIVLNAIYVNPEAIAWQTRLVRKLIRRGVPIDGITIGAGVPSLDVATGYIDDIGLKYISFKPGSADAILSVLKIADERPDFPIILQWTGGRGGGHHSFEDFHAPVFATYHECRKRKNVCLVAGGGFGAGEDTYPYMTGSWSEKLGYPAMPFDGVLFGSRLMVSREAHTSPEAKQLICSTPGIDDSQWEKTYAGGAGGIITVQSEMGQPIHKIANRGVRLWAELDRDIFSLPREKMVEKLRSKKNYIISRLNSDYAKPWFAVDVNGKPADLADMTYTAVLARMMQLMFVDHQSRWINDSYMLLVYNFVLRALSRLSSGFAPDLDVLRDPKKFLTLFKACCPDGAKRKLHRDDVTFFIQKCKARGQKPVNFVPALDADFEYWFKKDSLWQSEDVDAVVDQDVERVCILQGPVAVAHSTIPDESTQCILDGICDFHTSKLLDQHYGGQVDKVSSITVSSPASVVSLKSLESSDSDGSATRKVFHAEEVNSAGWQDTLASQGFQWICDMVREKHILRNGLRKSNPFRNAFDVQVGQTLLVNQLEQRVSLRNSASDQNILVIQRSEGDESITIDLVQPEHLTAAPAVLSLRYQRQSVGLSSALVEVEGGREARIKSFYSNLWLGYEMEACSLDDTFRGPPITLTSDMVKDLHKVLGYPASRFCKDDVAPDVAMVVAWDVLVKPLLIPAVDGDLLRLVHRDNSIEYCASAKPFKIGDALQSTSRIQSIAVEETGKSVVVKATISRHSRPVATVTSCFFMQGAFGTTEGCFENTNEPEFQLKVTTAVEDRLLRSREWLSLDDPTGDLIGKTLLFDLSTRACRGEKGGAFSSLCTSGTVLEADWNGVKTPVGRVKFQGSDCEASPVVDFLRRKAEPAVKQKDLDRPVQLYNASEAVQIPPSNEPYGRFSKDFNPIHVSPLFAQYAELPGTITHGMYTSAAIRSIVEKHTTDGKSERFRRWSCSFVGMVLPGDKLDVQVDQVGLVDGRMLLSVTAANAQTGDAVLRAEAEVEQAPTVYMFTGQGSQSQGMGMASYKSSPAAKKVWDDADKFLMEKFGWSVLELVHNNPTSLTVYFRGQRGRRVRANYEAMTIDTYREDGSVVKEPIIKEISPSSTSYTFSDPRGLLFSTQFAQPIIVLLEQAAMADLRHRGVVQDGAQFAGHSLGEYGALSAFSGFMSFEDLLQVVFYRGLAMQLAIERDDQGRTNFAMAAVNPARVGKFFSETSLKNVVEMIATTTKSLLEIVNFNVQGEQYVCAGTLENLHALGTTLDQIAKNPKVVGSSTSSEVGVNSRETKGREDHAVTEMVARSVAEARQLPSPIELKRGTALIPLQGIDVPFHSAHLRTGVPSYRTFLEERIVEGNIDPARLVDRWIPNVMGKPFSLGPEYIREAQRLTDSPILGKMLAAMEA